MGSCAGFIGSHLSAKPPRKTSPVHSSGCAGQLCSEKSGSVLSFELITLFRKVVDQNTFAWHYSNQITNCIVIWIVPFSGNHGSLFKVTIFLSMGHGHLIEMFPFHVRSTRIQLIPVGVIDFTTRRLICEPLQLYWTPVYGCLGKMIWNRLFILVVHYTIKSTNHLYPKYMLEAMMITRNL